MGSFTNLGNFEISTTLKHGTQNLEIYYARFVHFKAVVLIVTDLLLPFLYPSVCNPAINTDLGER